MKTIIKLIIFISISHPTLHCQEVTKVSAGPREVLVETVEIAKAYIKNPSGQNKEKFWGSLAVFKDKDTANSLAEWITGEIAVPAKAVTIHQQFWQKGDVAVCVIIQNRDFGFVDVDPMIMFRTKDHPRWVLAGTINLAENCELYTGNEETVATLLKSYDDAEDKIWRPLFEERQRRRTVEQNREK
jgi:hypothetical protein